MALTVTSNVPQVLDPAKSELFMDGFLSGEGVVYPKFFRLQGSGEQSIEKASLLPPAGFTSGVQGEDIPTSAIGQGNAVTYNMVERVIGYQIAAFLYGFITGNQMRQAQLGDFIRQMGVASQLLYDTDCMSVFANATTDLGADGVPMVDGSHPDEIGGTISNEGSTAMDHAALAAAFVVGARLPSPEGLRGSVRYDTVLCPPDLEVTARRLMVDTHISASNVATNDGNIVRGWIKDMVTSVELTDTNNWFLVATEGASPFRGNLYINRPPNPKEWIDPDSDNYKITDRSHHAFGHDNSWRSVFGATVA